MENPDEIMNFIKKYTVISKFTPDLHYIQDIIALFILHKSTFIILFEKDFLEFQTELIDKLFAFTISKFSDVKGAFKDSFNEQGDVLCLIVKNFYKFSKRVINHSNHWALKILNYNSIQTIVYGICQIMEIFIGTKDK